MSFILGILLLIISLANLWFFIRGLIIMSRENIGWAIGGFFVCPIVQIIFFFTQKDALDDEDSSAFVKYFISFVALIVLAVIFSIVTASSAMSQMA